MKRTILKKLTACLCLCAVLSGALTVPAGAASFQDVPSNHWAVDAIDRIKRAKARSIKFMCIIAAPEGLKALREKHPDVKIYCASEDLHLNENGYIVPGLGDAGDRIFGTK